MAKGHPGVTTVLCVPQWQGLASGKARRLVAGAHRAVTGDPGATRCRWRCCENPHPLPVLLAPQTTGTGSACGI